MNKLVVSGLSAAVVVGVVGAGLVAWTHAASAGNGDDWIADQAAVAQELLAKVNAMPEGPEKKAAAKAAIVALQQRNVDRLKSQHDDCVADQAKFHDPNDPVMAAPNGKALAAQLDALCVRQAEELAKAEASLAKTKAEP